MTDPKRQTKTAAVIPGRFNPPTVGHAKIITRAQKAKYDGRPVDAVFVLIIDGEKTGKDKKKNPLSGDRREYFMKQTVYGQNVKFIVAPNVFEAFVQVRKRGYEPLIVVDGSDRSSNYVNILDKYFTNDDGSEIEHEKMSFSRTSKEPPKDGKDVEGYVNPDSVKSLSGTMARIAAQHGMKEEFLEIVSTFDGITVMPEKIALKMYEEIRKAMGVEDNA